MREQFREIRLVFAIALLTPAVLNAQADGNAESGTAKKLPVFAEWRFGAANDIDLPGYYLLKFSPDGRYLAARNRDNIVEIRECRTRKLVSEVGGHDTKIRVLDFSTDGKCFLTAGDRTENVKVWETVTGKLLNEIECHPVFARFSPDGKQIWILDVIEPLERTRLLKYGWPSGMFSDHSDLRKNISYRGAISDSTRYLVGAQKTRRTVSLPKLIDTLNDSAVILEGPSDPPEQVAFSNDENWVAAIYPRKDSVRIWSLYDPANQKYELRGHKQTIKSISFSGDSRFLVSAGWDKKILVWDLLTKESIGVLGVHDEHVVATAIKPLSLKVATAANGLKDSTVIVWDLESMIFSNPPNRIAKDEFESSWRGLGVSSPVTALEHLNDIRHSIDEVFEQVEKKLMQRMAISRAQILIWINQLDSTTFLEREIATRNLMAARGPADKILREEMNSPGSTERHYRIKEILKQPLSRPAINAAELRRLHRGVMLLELISDQVQYSEQVITLLESLAQNHPHSNVCVDASATLERIKIRKSLEIQ